MEEETLPNNPTTFLDNLKVKFGPNENKEGKNTKTRAKRLAYNLRQQPEGDILIFELAHVPVRLSIHWNGKKSFLSEVYRTGWYW